MSATNVEKTKKETRKLLLNPQLDVRGVNKQAKKQVTGAKTAPC